ncbi:hypothetical protein BaRGS_00012799 [Batillaria attramentaria]|uniref:peptidylglycine monooxygenase n=1 Tax=Batillaria attramentaria TaxID=370345 RepID=A0ABD0LA34_9CAEN
MCSRKGNNQRRILLGILKELAVPQLSSEFTERIRSQNPLVFPARRFQFRMETVSVGRHVSVKMATTRLVVLLCVVGCTLTGEHNGSEDVFEMTIRMPNATSSSPDDLVCHGQKVPEKETYIVKFTPHASMRRAHHMMVYGCSQPGNTKPFWMCPFAEDLTSEPGLSICGEGEKQIVFAWANDAPAKNLPPGVGFRVGGTTGIDYLVIQLHYVHQFGADAADDSGVTLHMTYSRPPQQAGYYVMGNVGTIPPHMPAFRMESACTFNLNYTIFPIGYRTHGHNIAVVNSGYRIRDNTWHEIGRMSPQRPQTFYDTTTKWMDIRDGDILASRCTFNSMNRTQATQIGPTNADEMCNFYILYSTYEQKDLTVEYCFRGDSFKWSDYFAYAPPDASSLKDIPGAEEIRHKFNLDPR